MSSSTRSFFRQRAYVAGPMSNIPQHNFPAFDTAAELLRDRGVDVVSPAELDDPEIREEAMRSLDGSMVGRGETWGDFLCRDLKIVIDSVDMVYVLPGWSKSRGARLETFAAYVCGHPIYYLSGRRVPLARLLRAWEVGT